MEDEFDKLMGFFSLEESVKEKKLDEIFQETTHFFEKYQHVLSTGNEEEKAEIQEKMDRLRSSIRKERESTEKKLGVSSDEVKQITSDPKNFTTAQWAILQNAERSVKLEKDEFQRKLTAQKEERVKEMRTKNKKKRSSKKSSWLKS